MRIASIYNKEEIALRAARPEDAAELLRIYAPYVEKTAITFEYTVPTLKDFTNRIRTTLEKYPYIVAERANSRLMGYAYVGPFHAREAYDWAVETSIYIAEDARKLGLGRQLHDALADCLTELGYLNMYACIAAPAQENDPYLTRNSIDFHAHLGYRMVGTFYACGCKFNRWYDMVWMEKHLGDHKDGEPLEKPRRFTAPPETVTMTKSVLQ